MPVRCDHCPRLCADTPHQALCHASISLHCGLGSHSTTAPFQKACCTIVCPASLITCSMCSRSMTVVTKVFVLQGRGGTRQIDWQPSWACSCCGCQQAAMGMFPPTCLMMPCVCWQCCSLRRPSCWLSWSSCGASQETMQPLRQRMHDSKVRTLLGGGTLQDGLASHVTGQVCRSIDAQDGSGFDLGTLAAVSILHHWGSIHFDRSVQR